MFTGFPLLPSIRFVILDGQRVMCTSRAILQVFFFLFYPQPYLLTDSEKKKKIGNKDDKYTFTPCMEQLPTMTLLVL